MIWKSPFICRIFSNFTNVSTTLFWWAKMKYNGGNMLDFLKSLCCFFSVSIYMLKILLWFRNFNFCSFPFIFSYIKLCYQNIYVWNYSNILQIIIFFNVETRGRLGTCRCVRNAYFITLKITSNCALKCNLICSNLKHYMG